MKVIVTRPSSMMTYLKPSATFCLLSYVFCLLLSPSVLAQAPNQNQRYFCPSSGCPAAIPNDPRPANQMANAAMPLVLPSDFTLVPGDLAPRTASPNRINIQNGALVQSEDENDLAYAVQVAAAPLCNTRGQRPLP